jgi:NADH-quinone oxidoreductase subunit L
MDFIWLIPLLPAAGAALNGVIGVRAFGRTTAGAIACATMAAALGLSVWAFAGLLTLPPASRAYEVVLATWIPSIPLQTSTGIGAFSVEWAFRLDPLSGLMILVVTGIGLLIHIYATAYMKDEPRGGYARFFCYLNLFCFFMLLLVLGSSFIVMFVGWEGVGLCSYLLIGYWYERKSAADAGRKAFITNRIGDWAFLLGIFLVFVTFGTLDFRAVGDAAAGMSQETGQFGVLSAICLLLFIGATGKSAQIPLHVWLPDAMEGPTPVSALIHAATMVTAGVYMVARNAVLFSQAPLVMLTIAITGALTALMAATIGLVQNDIKRVLAYSTVSQLGYMFLATGVGAFAAAVFHLMTHAFFKALLFLGSGSVIHAVDGEQDLQRMGGLRRFMPITFATMMVGTLAIAGVPPLSGFFSKDEILYQTFLHNRALWALAIVTALLTAVYMGRLMALTFWGTSRAAAAHASHGPHEAPLLMTWPLIALAVGAAVAGFVGIPQALAGANAIEHFLAPSFTPSQALHLVGASEAVTEGSGRALELGLMLLSALVAAAGILVARQFYVARPEIPGQLAERPSAGSGRPEPFEGRWRGLYALLRNKYYVDEIYDATIVRGTYASARGLWLFDRKVIDGAVDGSSWVTRIAAWISHMFDKYVVDGLVNLIGWASGQGSFGMRRLQTGLVQNYALVMVFGVFIFLTVYLLAR